MIFDADAAVGLAPINHHRRDDVLIDDVQQRIATERDNLAVANPNCARIKNDQPGLGRGQRTGDRAGVGHNDVLPEVPFALLMAPFTLMSAGARREKSFGNRGTLFDTRHSNVRMGTVMSARSHP